MNLRAIVLAASDHLASLLLLSGFAYAGAAQVRLLVPLQSLVAIALVIYAIAAASGYRKRIQAPVPIRLQALAACGIHLTGLLLAPQIAYLFAANLLLPLSCGALHYRRRILFAVWVLAAVSAIILFESEAASAAAMEPHAERGMMWLLAAISLARLSAIHACVADLRRQLHRKNEELQAAIQRLAGLASRDELTGLWNRHEFMRLMQEESRRAVRNRTHFCIAVIDIDCFEQLGERHGHLSGEAVLKEMAQLLELERRATDSAARYDSGQFALLLPQAKLSTATVAIERLRHQIMRHEWSSVAPGLQLTVSAGVAEWKAGETLVQTLNRAQAALREAKAAGHNRVRAALDAAPA